jgi:hypothetical protein
MRMCYHVEVHYYWKLGFYTLFVTDLLLGHNSDHEVHMSWCICTLPTRGCGHVSEVYKVMLC